LRFRVTAEGRPASGRTVYVRFFDKDAGYDRDPSGNLGDAWDSDEPIGAMQAVQINNGEGWITATGDAVDPGDTYAVVFLDEGGRTSLARSDVMP